MVMVKILPGDGTSELFEVEYCAPYPMTSDGQCAYCKGDPCNDDGDEASVIAGYYRENSWADTCPICDGRT